MVNVCSETPDSFAKKDYCCTQSVIGMKGRVQYSEDKLYPTLQQFGSGIDVQSVETDFSGSFCGPQNDSFSVMYPLDYQQRSGSMYSYVNKDQGCKRKTGPLYDSPKSPYRDNAPFFIPSLTLVSDDFPYTNKGTQNKSTGFHSIASCSSFADCDINTYSSRRSSNFSGEMYSFTDFETPIRNVSERRGTYDMSFRSSGVPDRSRLLSEPAVQLGDIGFQNIREAYYPYSTGTGNFGYGRPRCNAEYTLQFDDNYEDSSLDYSNYLIQSESVDPFPSRSFSPPNTSRASFSSANHYGSSTGNTGDPLRDHGNQLSSKSNRRKTTKKVVDSSTTLSNDDILNPDDIDPTVNPRVFSGRKPKKNMDYSRFRINIADVRSGKDTRLTLMIRNIPNSFTQDHMLELLDVFVRDEYDFFYMPVDFRTNCNLGFGYVSMISTASVVKLYEKLNGTKWNNTSTKVCEVNYARMQGKSDMQKFCKDWTIMHLPEKYRPVFFNREVHVVSGKEVVTMKRVNGK